MDYARSNRWIFVLVFIITCFMLSCHAADHADDDDDDDDGVGSPPSAEKRNNTNVIGIINSWILNRYKYLKYSGKSISVIYTDKNDLDLNPE